MKKLSSGPSPANYLAICILDYMGLQEPDQRQIEFIESALVANSRPGLLQKSEFNEWIKKDRIASEAFKFFLLSKSGGVKLKKYLPAGCDRPKLPDFKRLLDRITRRVLK